MNTDTTNASNPKDSPATIETAPIRGRGPTVLTEPELQMVAAAGGLAGGVIDNGSGSAPKPSTSTKPK